MEKQIFFGNSHPGCTESRILDLYRLVNEAISIAGGLQQPDHPISAEHYKQCQEIRLKEHDRLEEFVRDIVMMILGKNVIFLDKE